MLKMIPKILLTTIGWIAICFITSCANTPVNKSAPVEVLYDKAAKAMLTDKYSLAIENFEQIESQYPFGKYATLAQLGLISAYYKKGEMESTIAAAEHFIRLNPQHEKADYAFYMKGLSKFESHKAFLQRFLPIDTAKRDQTTAKEAFNDFSELIRRFPKSEYVADARQRMVYLRNHVADSEFNIAEYYYNRKAYVAALARTKGIIENYPNTTAVPKALLLQSYAYRELGLTALADESQALLKNNYAKLLKDAEERSKKKEQRRN